MAGFSVGMDRPADPDGWFPERSTHPAADIPHDGVSVSHPTRQLTADDQPADEESTS